jgi:enterochelin esterase family protein
MKPVNPMTARVAATVLAILTLATAAPAQPGRGGRGPMVVSPEVKADRTVAFRLAAPKAEAVRLNSSDMPNDRNARALKKGDNGVWELTVGPVNPGTYRYTFDVDGLRVADPRNTAISESNGNFWSVVHVPGEAAADLTDVPHGALAAVTYRSSALKLDRRMHVYTPPGYETGTEKYPVFYLLHGAGDCDDSWTSVGRANFILDNLIAAKKAKPMIVVMPAGHTPGGGGRGGRGGPGAGSFEDDFAKDIRPYVESHYRVLTDRANRAIAGLSMGGSQTLSIAVPALKDYGYVGVYSSGMLFGNAADWERQNQANLDDAGVRAGLKLLWFATGSQDGLIQRTRDTVELFKKHGFSPVFKETAGGHTWINWRAYLTEFAPQLFQ